MKIRALDGNGDWTFGKGRNNYFLDKDALSQLVVCRIKEIVNDCFWNTTAGVDWFNLLGSKNPTALLLAINAVILSTPGIIAIENTEFIEIVDREFTIRYKLQTVYGPFDFSLPSIDDLRKGDADA